MQAQHRDIFDSIFRYSSSLNAQYVWGLKWSGPSRGAGTESGLNMAPQHFPAKCAACSSETGLIPCVLKKKKEEEISSSVILH